MLEMRKVNKAKEGIAFGEESGVTSALLFKALGRSVM